MPPLSNGSEIACTVQYCTHAYFDHSNCTVNTLDEFCSKAREHPSRLCSHGDSARARLHVHTLTIVACPFISVASSLMEDVATASAPVPRTETPHPMDDAPDVPLEGLHEKVRELLSADSGAGGSGQGDKLVSSAAGTAQAFFPQPQLASWYVPGKVHAVEKRALPEFFLGRFASKTPANYIQIRDAMIGAWRRAPSRYVTSTSLRRHLRGDACALLRVHTFLEHWGLINYGVDAEARPQPSAPPTPAPVTESLRRRVIASRVHLEEAAGGPAAKRRRSSVPLGRAAAHAAGDGCAAADLSGSDDEDELVGLEVGLAGGSAGPPLFADDGRLLSADDKTSNAAGVDTGDVGGPGEAPAIEYHCDECGADCSRTRFHCATRADMDLCARCHAARRYPRSMQARDFIQMTGGVAAASSRSGGSSAAWTDSETLLLLEALELYGDRWELVAEHVGSKTKDACVAHFLRIPIEDAFLGDEGTSRWWPGSGTTPRESPPKTARDATAGAESLAAHPLLGKSVLNTAIAALGAWGRPRQSGKPLPFLSSKGLPSRDDMVMVRAAFLVGAIRSPSAMAAFVAAQSSLSLVNAAQRPPRLPWMTMAGGESRCDHASEKADAADGIAKGLGAAGDSEERPAAGEEGSTRPPAPVSILSSEDGLAAAEAALWAARAALGVDKADDDAAGLQEEPVRTSRAEDASHVCLSLSATPGAEATPAGPSSGPTVDVASEQQRHQQQQQTSPQDGLLPDANTPDGVEDGVADDGVTPMKRATHIAARRRGVRALKDGTADKPSVDAIAGVVLAVAAVRARELVDAETVNIKALNERALEAQLEVLDAKVAHIRWYDALSQLIDQKARRDHATEFMTGVAHASARVSGDPTDGSDSTCIPATIHRQFTAALQQRALSADDCVPRVTVVPCGAGAAANLYVGPPTKDHPVPDAFFAANPPAPSPVYAPEPSASADFTAVTAGATAETASRAPGVAAASSAPAGAVEPSAMDIGPTKLASTTYAAGPATLGQLVPLAGAPQLSTLHVPQTRAPVAAASVPPQAPPIDRGTAPSPLHSLLPAQPLVASQASAPGTAGQLDVFPGPSDQVAASSQLQPLSTGRPLAQRTGPVGMETQAVGVQLVMQGPPSTSPAVTSVEAGGLPSTEHGVTPRQQQLQDAQKRQYQQNLTSGTGEVGLQAHTVMPLRTTAPSGSSQLPEPQVVGMQPPMQAPSATAAGASDMDQLPVLLETVTRPPASVPDVAPPSLVQGLGVGQLLAVPGSSAGQPAPAQASGAARLARVHNGQATERLPIHASATLAPPVSDAQAIVPSSYDQAASLPQDYMQQELAPSAVAAPPASGSLRPDSASVASLDAALAGGPRGVDVGGGAMGYHAAAGTAPSLGPPPLPVGTPAQGAFLSDGQSGLSRDLPPALRMGGAPTPDSAPPRELLQEESLAFGAGSLGAHQPRQAQLHPQPPQPSDAQPRPSPLPGVGVGPQHQAFGSTPSADGMAWSAPSLPSGGPDGGPSTGALHFAPQPQPPPPAVDAASFLGVTQDAPSGNSSLPQHAAPSGGFGASLGGADPCGGAGAVLASTAGDADAILSALAVSSGMSFRPTGGGVPRGGDGLAAVGGGGGGGFYPPVSMPGGTGGPAGGVGAYPPVSMSGRAGGHAGGIGAYPPVSMGGSGGGYPPVGMGGDGAGYLSGSVPASGGMSAAGGGGHQSGASLAGTDGGLPWPPVDSGGAYSTSTDAFLPLGGGAVDGVAAAADGSGAPPHPPPGLPFPAPAMQGAPPG